MNFYLLYSLYLIFLLVLPAYQLATNNILSFLLLVVAHCSKQQHNIRFYDDYQLLVKEYFIIILSNNTALTSPYTCCVLLRPHVSPRTFLPARYPRLPPTTTHKYIAESQIKQEYNIDVYVTTIIYQNYLLNSALMMIPFDKIYIL